MYEKSEVEFKVRAAARETAAAMLWLVDNHDIEHRSWREALRCVEQFRLARQRFSEGEYELAENALPEFYKFAEEALPEL